jgi:uncharacterized protein (DUF4415 family)
MYDPIKVVSGFAAAGRGMTDRINKIFRIYRFEAAGRE